MGTIVDTNPATGETIREIETVRPQDIPALVARARRAFETWSTMPIEERRRRVVSAGARLAEAAEELAELITQEMGKPIADARREAQGQARGLAESADQVVASLAPERFVEGGSETVVEHVPHGVVAAITPWNFPLGMPLSVLIPALVAGNTVVFKPSEHVPLCGARLAEILAADLPEDVLVLAQGAGDIGDALVRADVDMVGFVGSRRTGKRIMEAAAGGLKRLVLELGGKDPLVVFDDADLEAAAECAVRHALRNTGQVCCSVERVYVAEKVAERFEALAVEKAKAWKHGDGREEGVKMGPLVSADQRRAVHAQVEEARQAGASIQLGGELGDGPGYFYPATVVTNLVQDRELMREETFGPVVAIARFSGSEDDAVRLANDTEYGLGANVFTEDLDRGKRVARRIRSGQVGINRYLTAASAAPWVGARQSGFGYLGGKDGHRQFTVPRSIAYPV